MTKRKVFNFNTGWLFRWGSLPDWYRSDLCEDEFYAVNLPHTVRPEPMNCSDCHNYQGKCLYRKRFVMDNEDAGKRVWLEFEGAMQVADVYINNQPVSTHFSGFLPFVMDITSYLFFDGRENVCCVELDNSDNALVPPGRDQKGLDFCYFGGLYRNATVTVVDPVHISNSILADKIAGGGQFIRYTDVSETGATIHVQTHVVNESSVSSCVTLFHELLNRDNICIAAMQSNPYDVPNSSNQTFRDQLQVTNPQLWSDVHPYLYTLKTTVIRNGIPCDELKTRIGIRTFSFSYEQGFLLNNKPVVLNGCNRHQEYANVGYAMSDNLQYRDAVLIKEAGFNFCRIGHYPNARSFMDALDELGIMSVVPPPGWHFWSDNPVFVQRCRQDIREMVRENRNHPGVVMWEPLLNESPIPQYFIEECRNITHEEYPFDSCYCACDAHKSLNYEVLYGWKSIDSRITFSREYNDALEDQNYSAMQLDDGRLVHYWTDRGDGLAYRGNEAAQLWSCRDRGSNGVSSLDGHWNLIRQHKGFTGMCIWSMFDYNRGCQTNYSSSGLMDLYRMPKFNYYLYKAQRSPQPISDIPVDSGPMVFIASWWNEQSSSTVHVFSNCEEVHLYLNGLEQGRLTATPNLGMPHPPFVFYLDQFTPGQLDAIGYISGIPCANHRVTTASKPIRLRLDAPFYGREMTADGSDLLLVTATICDDEDNICFSSSSAVTFRAINASIIGDGDSRVGVNPSEAIGGKACVLIQAKRTPGDIIITAESKGLEPARLTITAHPCTDALLEGITQGQLPPPSTEPGYAPPTKSHYADHRDYALNCPASASSFLTGFEPAMANNDERITRWLAADNDLPAWWQVDLGDIKRITALMIAWDNDRTFYTFDVFTSKDKVDWRGIYTGSQSGQDYGQILKCMSMARYVRILIKGIDGPGRLGIVQVRILGDW